MSYSTDRQLIEDAYRSVCESARKGGRGGKDGRDGRDGRDGQGRRGESSKGVEGVSFSVKSPSSILEDESLLKDYLKLHRELDEAERKYYRKVGWHWVFSTKDEIKKGLEKKVRKVFAATLDGTGRLIGFITVLDSLMGKGSLLVSQFVVSEKFRGKGIGKALFDYMLGKTGGKDLHLMVAAPNEAARKLYESAGFHTISMGMYRRGR